MAVRKFLRQRREKVAEDERLVGHGRELARLNFGGIDDLEMAADERLRALLRSLLVVKEVEGVKVLVVRVDAVAGEPAAQTVGAVVHDGDRLDHTLARHTPAAAVDDARDRAAGRISELSFFRQHTVALPEQNFQ